MCKQTTWIERKCIDIIAMPYQNLLFVVRKLTLSIRGCLILQLINVSVCFFVVCQCFLCLLLIIEWFFVSVYAQTQTNLLIKTFSAIWKASLRSIQCTNLLSDKKKKHYEISRKTQYSMKPAHLWKQSFGITGMCVHRYFEETKIKHKFSTALFFFPSSLTRCRIAPLQLIPMQMETQGSLVVISNK